MATKKSTSTKPMSDKGEGGAPRRRRKNTVVGPVDSEGGAVPLPVSMRSVLTAETGRAGQSAAPDEILQVAGGAAGTADYLRASEEQPLDLGGGQSVPTVPAEKHLEKDLVKRSAASLRAPMRIFQIYFESWQRELLDPAFAGLDNSKSTSELYEFDVFTRLAQSEYIRGAELWGAVSWRFTEKTGMSGQDWIKYIEAHPGADVYFCNPVPENDAIFHNLWLQGETSHPQFFSLAQAIFQVTGLPKEELVSIQSSEMTSVANYFVATPKFWASYLPWAQTVLSLANKKLPAPVRDLLHQPLADDRGLHGGATYVPFVVERLFPVFMKTQGKALRGVKVPLPERERELNVHLKLLLEMKDVAHRTKSAWLAACWVNYRNLYLSQVRGKEWCAKYLRTITPTDIHFG